jgi:hypothetical protein
MFRHTLISSVRDEGPFLLEWIAHHIVVGFDRICIASNDCRDGSDSLLSALANAGFIEHFLNNVPEGKIPQHVAYEGMRRHLQIDNTEWLMVLDADEFLNIHVGGNRIHDLTRCAGADCDIIALHAMFFTGAPETIWRPGLLCPRHTWRLPLAHNANRAIKTLTRHPSRFLKIREHALGQLRTGTQENLIVINGNGARFNPIEEKPLWDQLRGSQPSEDCFKLAHYNHYGVKTWDSFAVRRQRGRGAAASGDTMNARHTEVYFRQRSASYAEDFSIARYAEEVQAQVSKMLEHPSVASEQLSCERLYGRMCASIGARQSANNEKKFFSRSFSGLFAYGHAKLKSRPNRAPNPRLTSSKKTYSPLIRKNICMEQTSLRAFEKALKQSKIYLEFGSGGSTLLACRLGVPVIHTVETDRDFLRATVDDCRAADSNVSLYPHLVEIGRTKQWGYPIDESGKHNWPLYVTHPWTEIMKSGLAPDLVLIDGRFRVAAFLYSFALCPRGARIFVDDYRDRKHYHVVERLAKPRAFHGRMAEFRKRREPNMSDCLPLIMRSLFDPR